MRTPIDFEIAKLVKEKGFNEVCQKWYSVEGGLYYQDEFDNNRGFIPVCECEAPTISEVVMWLYEKHGIWISVNLVENTNEDLTLLFDFIIHNKKSNTKHSLIGLHFEPTEAYEAAIEYTLKNLI